MSNLTKCVECGQPVSKIAQTCPHCESWNVHGITCAICQVGGIKQSEVMSQSSITFHKDCYNKVTNSFSRKAPFIHTCEACLGQNLVNFTEDMSRSHRVFDLSDYRHSDFIETKIDGEYRYHWTFSCKHCGHPNEISLYYGNIYYPYSLCECCKLRLNIDDSVVLYLSSYDSKIDRIDRKELYVHKLCYQTPKNKARLDEMVRVSEENASRQRKESEENASRQRKELKEQRKELEEEDFWREGGGIFGILGATWFGAIFGGLLTASNIWLLQLLGILIVISSAYYFIKGIYYFIKGISKIFRR
jgi:hypothetical protein